MLHINENLYINFSSMLTFSIGNLDVDVDVDVYDSRWLASPYIYSTCLIKIQVRILSNTF